MGSWPGALNESRRRRRERQLNNGQRTKGLMSHRVGHDVDAHGIRLLLRERAEVFLALALALPAVAEVGVVADDDHHPLLVVEDPLVMHGLAARAVILPGLAGVLPGVDAGDLRLLLELVDAAED